MSDQRRTGLQPFLSDVWRPYPAASVGLRVPLLQLLACIVLFIPEKLYVFRAAIPAADAFVGSLNFKERVVLARALTFEGLTLCVACELAFLLTMYLLPTTRITLRRAVAFTWGGLFFAMSAYQLAAFLHWEHFFTYPSWAELHLTTSTGPLLASLGRLLDDRPFASMFVLFALLHSGALYAALRSSKPLNMAEIRAWVSFSAVVAGFALSGWIGPRFPLAWDITTHPIVALLYSQARMTSPKVMQVTPGSTDECSHSSFAPTADGQTAPAPRWPRPVRAEDMPHVVVLFWESIPARRVYPWNPDPKVTPRLAAMRDRLCTFDRFYSNGSLSFPSRFEFLFGEYCPMAVQNWGIRSVPFSLPEVFKHAGYRTFAIGSNNMQFSGTQQMLMQAGFDEIEEPTRYGEGYLPHVWGVDDRVAFDRLKIAIEEKHRAPLFTLVLSSTTHHPYQMNLPGFPPESLEPVDRYAAGIRFDDALIADFADWLDHRKDGRPVVFVVVGDHGEAFSEHPGVLAHGNSLYEEATHVTAFVVGRQRLGLPDHISTLGSMIDLPPTVLELAGIPAPPEYQGRSIAKSPPDGEVIAYLPYLEARLSLRDGSYTLITGLEGRKSELYDAHADPDEKRDLSRSMPERVECMRRRLASWLELQNPLWKHWFE